MLPDKNKCTGCSACAAICNKKAIKMIPDSYGLLFPEIDSEICVNCGMCKKICPCLSESNRSTIKEIYGVSALDKDVRLNSSSGGLFSLIADYVLENNGVVCGCKMDDNCRKCSHVLIESKNDLYLLRGSKYFQSEIGEVYVQIKRLLDEDKYVLFTGTPCQVAGLSSFLRKPYERLLMVDVICHGVPAPAIWAKYIDYSEASSKSKVEQVSFRDKTNGWRGFSVKLVYANGEKIITPISKDLFMRGFLENLFLRKSCYECHFKGDNYYSDLTMADFWGIQEIKPELDDNTGYSLAICHSEKSLSLLSEILQHSTSFVIDEASALKRNQTYYKPPRMNYWREKALNEFDIMPFDRVIEKYCGLSLGAKIRRKISLVAYKRRKNGR